ncbi:uncharacterized protein TrAFT101_000856 [Trichoderma asperellum]|uniref:uncharacterized protein n=1 Tax=Trichoderma asperellum TaxID=101201 RepID=UPI00333076E3|nr:hypothetical protein TrAFT101_000856 [Trichoderma asperellum]
MGCLAPYSRKKRERERLVSFTAAPLYRLDARHCSLSFRLELDARMLVINLGLDSAQHGYERMYENVPRRKIFNNKFALGQYPGGSVATRPRRSLEGLEKL